MTDTNHSQPQQTNPFFPFPALPGLDAWRQAVETHLERMGTLQGEVTRAQSAGAEQARVAIDESARLLRESLAYTMQLSTEWQRQSLDAARRAVELMTPRT